MGAHRLAQTAAIIHALSVIPCRSMQIDFPDTTGKVDGPVLVAIGALALQGSQKIRMRLFQHEGLHQFTGPGDPS